MAGALNVDMLRAPSLSVEVGGVDFGDLFALVVADRLLAGRSRSAWNCRLDRSPNVSLWLLTLKNPAVFPSCTTRDVSIEALLGTIH